jgi:hypothetical protein
VVISSHLPAHRAVDYLLADAMEVVLRLAAVSHPADI